MTSPLDRIKAITAQLQTTTTGGGLGQVLRKSPDDIVITCALRTPLTKARKGALKDTPVEELVVHTLQAIQQQSRIDPALVEDVCLGNVLHPMASYAARAAVLAAGFPVTTAASVASRWCSSGLLCTQMIANQILAGAIDVGIAIGAESMSLNPDAGAPPLSDRVLASDLARDTTMPMGWTAENVARDFGVSRAAQDQFAARSQQKAEQAQRLGWTADEIFAVHTRLVDPQTQQAQRVAVTKDEGVRPGTTPEGLHKLKAAFPQWAPSTTTGGNASQITDGAAGLLLMKRSTAARLGQPVLARFVGATVAGLEPRIMGIGPVFAIPKLLGKLGLSLGEVDVFEINEAFSSMGVFCVDSLGIDPAKVNPRGGAVALGHPLGATGARQVVTGLSELRRQRKKVLVTSMCVGTGQSMAGLFVNEQL